MFNRGDGWAITFGNGGQPIKASLCFFCQKIDYEKGCAFCAALFLKLFFCFVLVPFKHTSVAVFLALYRKVRLAKTDTAFLAVL